jgi:hypothetical protein
MRLVPIAALTFAVLASAAVAGPAPTSYTSEGPLTRFQSRLEADAFRVLSPEVLGASKDALAARRAELGGARSVTEWQSLVLAYAPALEKASKVLVRRTEVIWAEERLADPYSSSIVQQASIGALQRGLVRVLSQFGVPVAPGKEASTSRPAAAAVHVAKRPAPAAAVAPVPTGPVRSSSAALQAYRAGLDAETFRILAPEMVGGVHRALAARRLDLRSAQTVAHWTAIAVQAAPSLDKACRVLARRAEVRPAKDGVVDAYGAPAVQRAAVEGLQAGLERILVQFGV